MRVLKISAFAKKFNIAINTVRYYVSLGLIVPIKKGSQYEFDQTSIDDMLLIVKLKQFHFTLQEVHRLLSFKRISLFSNREDIAFFIHLLAEKKETILQNVKALNETIALIDESIQELSSIKVTKAVTGVPIQFIPLLYCPLCQVPLRLENAFIQNQHISEATLVCPCSYEARIEDGIVFTPRKDGRAFVQPHFYEHEVFEQINSSLVSIIEKGSQWIFSKLEQIVRPDQVVIETHCESYVFLPKFLTSLQPYALYIFCGASLDMMTKLKNKIEHINPNLSVLYVLNHDLQFPLKHRAIDLVIDSLSFNDHSLSHNYFPLHKIEAYLHAKSQIIGNFSYYDANAKSLVNLQRLYTQSVAFNLFPDFFDEQMNHFGFELTEKEYIGNTTQPGRYVDFHLEEDKIHFVAYSALYSQNR